VTQTERAIKDLIMRFPLPRFTNGGMFGVQSKQKSRIYDSLLLKITRNGHAVDFVPQNLCIILYLFVKKSWYLF